VTAALFLAAAAFPHTLGDATLLKLGDAGEDREEELILLLPLDETGSVPQSGRTRSMPRRFHSSTIFSASEALRKIRSSLLAITNVPGSSALTI
jgi:hypothetical protein